MENQTLEVGNAYNVSCHRNGKFTMKQIEFLLSFLWPFTKKQKRNRKDWVGVRTQRSFYPPQKTYNQLALHHQTASLEMWLINRRITRTKTCMTKAMIKRYNEQLKA